MKKTKNWTYCIFWTPGHSRDGLAEEKALEAAFQPDAFHALTVGIELMHEGGSAITQWWKLQDTSLDSLVELGAEKLAIDFIAEGKLPGVKASEIDYVTAFAPDAVLLEVPR